MSLNYPNKKINFILSFIFGKNKRQNKINSNYSNEFELVSNNSSEIVKIKLNLDVNKIDIESMKLDPEYKLGVHYQFVEKKYDQMKIYYIKSIKNGNSLAMCNLGFYYQYIEKNYEQMKKYYLMAIEYAETNAMFNLSHYYRNIEYDYVLADKYLNMFGKFI